MEFWKKPRTIVIGLVCIGVVMGLFGLIGKYTSLRNEGRSQEIAISAEFRSTMARYGQFRTAVYDELTIAREKRDALNKILVDATAGRYDRKDKPGTVDRQALVNAIAEAYPDLKGLNIYDKVLTEIQAGRERFSKDQETIQDMVRSYNSWRDTGGTLDPWLIGMMGFPSDRLKVQIGDKTYTGQEALDKISTVIVGADTREIFDSGEDKPLGK